MAGRASIPARNSALIAMIADEGEELNMNGEVYVHKHPEMKDIEALLLLWFYLQEQLDEESFEDYRSGMIATLLEKDPSLLSETDELWSQIVDKRYMFDYSQKEAEELRNIEKKDVIKWYN